MKKISKYLIVYVVAILMRAYALLCMNYDSYYNNVNGIMEFGISVVLLLFLPLLFYFGKYMYAKRNYFLIGLIYIFTIFIHIFIDIYLLVFELGLLIFLLICLIIEKKVISKENRSYFKESLTRELVEEEETKSDNLKYLFCGFSIFVLSIIFLEKFHNYYYFTQDDNFHQFLPSMLFGCQSLLEKGIFAEINPYQLTGIPLAAAGVYSLTNPVTYFSYVIAKFLFHNQYAMIDVFCIIHLAIAYFASYYAAKSCGVKNYLRVIFALFYSLSGYSLIAVRSWYLMAPSIAFAPLIVVSINYLIKNKPNLKWIILNGVVLGFLFYSGNVQMWVYIVMFFVFSAFFMFILKKIDLRKIFAVILSNILAASIAAPLLFVSMDLFKGINRGFIVGRDFIFQNFPTLIFPNYIVSFLNDDFYNTYRGELLFSGGIFLFISFVALLLIIKEPESKILKFIDNNPWLIIGLFALWLGLGEHFGLWSLVHILPGLKNFTNPHRMMVFINLFLNLSGAIILSRHKVVESKKFRNGLCVLVIVLLGLHLVNARPAFFVYKIKPYSDFSQIEKNIKDIREHRVITLCDERSANEEFPLSLTNNFASVYHVYSLNAYNDNLENNLPEYYNISKIRDFSKEYGVKYLFFQNLVPYMATTKYMINKNQGMLKFLKSHNKIKYRSKNVEIYEVDNYKPMAYIEETVKPLKVEFTGFGAIVNTEPLNKTATVIVNIIDLHNYKAYLDNGKQVPIIKDKARRISVVVPKGNKRLIIKYHSPWEKGALLGLTIFFIFVVLIFIFNKIDNCKVSGNQ